MPDVEFNSYILDETDTIVSVDPLWDQFAVENNAPDAMAKNVIGRKVWDFVEGGETASYLSTLFYACRMDTEVFELLYRCDAPEVQRLFRLSIHPDTKGGLILKHVLVHTKERLRTSKVTIFTDHFDHTRCSICCAFLIGKKWINTFTYPDSRYFAVSYTVCPGCRDIARKKIDEVRNKGGDIGIVNFPMTDS